MDSGRYSCCVLCSLVFVMEQLSRAISYLERCQSYFLTSSICANQCMVENSLLHSVFSTKYISSKINQPNFSENFDGRSWPRTLVLWIGTNNEAHLDVLLDLSFSLLDKTNSFINQQLALFLVDPSCFWDNLGGFRYPRSRENILFTQNLNWVLVLSHLM